MKSRVSIEVWVLSIIMMMLTRISTCIRAEKKHNGFSMLHTLRFYTPLIAMQAIRFTHSNANDNQLSLAVDAYRAQKQVTYTYSMEESNLCLKEIHMDYSNASVYIAVKLYCCSGGIQFTG